MQLWWAWWQQNHSYSQIRNSINFMDIFFMKNQGLYSKPTMKRALISHSNPIRYSNIISDFVSCFFFIFFCSWNCFLAYLANEQFQAETTNPLGIWYNRDSMANKSLLYHPRVSKHSYIFMILFQIKLSRSLLFL